MLKKVVTTIINAVSVLIITAAVLVLLAVVLTGSGKAPSVLGYSVFRVMTGSMEPEIETDSMIIVRAVDPADIAPGDIISFYSDDPSLDGAVNTHRVVSAQQDGDGWLFTTKGDANLIEDSLQTSDDDVIGRVIFVSHGLGVAVRLLSNPLIFGGIIVLPLIILLCCYLHRTVKIAKNMMKQEEEAAVRQAVEEIREKKRKQEEAAAAEKAASRHDQQ